MFLLGLIRLSVFLFTWVFGAISIPLALIEYFIYGKYRLLFIIITYYTFRFIFPAKKWNFFKRLITLSEYPYCNSQNVIFEDGATLPDPKSKIMLTCAPHGILTLGFSCLASSLVFDTSDIKWLVTDLLLKLPFIRDFMVWIDAWEVSKSRMLHFLEKGENIALIPGGFQEATIYIRNRHRIYIKERKGFIKYALQYGYSIMPCYVFGEERTYWQTQIGSLKFRFWLNKYNIPTIAFIGKFGILPDNNIDVSMVIGKKFDLPKISDPSEADINKYHQVYIEKIQALFDKHKCKYAYTGEEAKLEIF